MHQLRQQLYDEEDKSGERMARIKAEVDASAASARKHVFNFTKICLESRLKQPFFLNEKTVIRRCSPRHNVCLELYDDLLLICYTIELDSGGTKNLSFIE